jgi:DNA adenine methylase
LQSLWARYRDRRLVEPLCGGLAVALGLSPARALLNDINPHTINFYRWLQSGPQLTLPVRYDSALYYDYRQRFNALIAAGEAGSTEAAELFYYLNRTGFNGLCRFNSKGEFNVPFGSYKRIGYTHDFTAYKGVFDAWTFSVGDFEELAITKTDFIYADPPYDVEFTQFAPRDFVWEDQERLARWLARHPGPVIASNSYTARVVDLYRGLGFEVYTGEAPRSISCNGDRSPAIEILAIKR